MTQAWEVFLCSLHYFILGFPGFPSDAWLPTQRITIKNDLFNIFATLKIKYYFPTIKKANFI